MAEPHFGKKELAALNVPLERRINVAPGDHRVAGRGYLLSTLLGSCVAACIFDAEVGVGGLNHFLLPTPRIPDSMPLAASAGGRYGVNAMELLINSLLKKGASRRALRAKVFGGAALLEFSNKTSLYHVGENNQRFVLEFLQGEGIPIVGQDLGGHQGRVIYFHTDTFSVWRRYIHNSATAARVAEREAAAWNRGIPQASSGDAILFDE